ncbi:MULTISPECIES: hypothetical protein [unclassified Paenibacillus]|nr:MULTISPECIES: hypothetical protein [unclassified Paenibacillus]
MDERDFIVALQHIQEAGYTDRKGNSLSQTGLDYINGYERRTHDSRN